MHALYNTCPEPVSFNSDLQISSFVVDVKGGSFQTDEIIRGTYVQLCVEFTFLFRFPLYNRARYRFTLSCQSGFPLDVFGSYTCTVAGIHDFDRFQLSYCQSVFFILDECVYQSKITAKVMRLFSHRLRNIFMVLFFLFVMVTFSPILPFADMCMALLLQPDYVFLKHLLQTLVSIIQR